MGKRNKTSHMRGFFSRASQCISFKGLSALKSIRSSLDKLSRQTLTRVALAWTIVAIVMGGYWYHLYGAHEAQLQQAVAQTHLRADQTAHALMLQTTTLIDQVDYIAHHLGEHWRDDSDAEFRRAISVAQSALPEGALMQVAIADEQGTVVFSSLTRDIEGASRVSIADREHFRIHAQGRPSQLFVSHPVLGRISKKWTVPFSLPIFDNDAFAGVIVISISPEYMSHSLRDMYPDADNVALLLRDDGAYLARSQDLGKVLGKSVPANRAFLTNPALQSGAYRVVAPIDGVRRYYAWYRTPNAPLILSLGLSEEKALAPAHASLRASKFQNALGTSVLLLALLWITLLYLKNRRQTEALLSTSEQLAMALRGGNLGTWDWDFRTNMPQFNERWGEMLGDQEVHLPVGTSKWEKLVHPDDLERVRAEMDKHLRGESAQFEAEYRLRHHNGNWVWLLDRGQVVKRGPDGDALRMAGTVLDITERKHAEVVQAESHERLATLLQRFPGGVLMEDANNVVVMANQLFCDLFDLADDPEMLSGLSHVALRDRLGAPRADWLHSPDGSGREQRKTIETTTPDGHTLEIDWVPIARDKDHLGRVWLVRDISQRKQQEARLTALATTDTLTGLPNRRSFMLYLDNLINDSASYPQDGGALLALDIDHFKHVNDTYGHPAGDAVLQHAAHIIRDTLRESDTPARLGGEEFAVLLPRTSLEDARALANRLRETLGSTPAVTEKGNVTVTMSIGLVMLAGASAKEAVGRADEALYTAKAAGRNQVQVWGAKQAEG